MVGKEKSSIGKRSEHSLFAILNNPPTNPFELLDISMLLYHKETGHLDGEAKLV